MARTPQYVELADRLQARWARLPSGSLVESEHQLADEFGVNRLTAREAVRELERRMVVRRVMGRGTFTAHRLDYEIRLGGIASFHRSVQALGHVPDTRVVDIGWVGRGPARRLAVERVSSVDGFVAASSTDWFPRAVGERIAGGITDGVSLHRRLEECGHEPRRSEVRVSVEMPSSAHAERLGFSSAAAPTWRVRSETIDRPSRASIHSSESWMRTDMFAVSVVIDTGETLPK